MLTVSSHKPANALGNRGRRSEAEIPLHTKTGGGLVIILPAHRRATLAARNRRAACQILVAVGRLPVVRRFELRALEKLYPAEIRLVEVGAIDNDLEKIGALKVRTREIGAAEIGTAKIGILKVGTGKIGSLKVQAAKGAA